MGLEWKTKKVGGEINPHNFFLKELDLTASLAEEFFCIMFSTEILTF